MLSIKKHPFLGFSVIATDTITILLSFFLAYQFRFFGRLVPAAKGIPDIEVYIRAMVVVIPVFLFMFRTYQLYRPERHLRRVYELLNVIKAITMATLVLMSITFFYREFSYSRFVLLFGWMFSIFFCCVGRYFLIQFEYLVRSKKDRQRILMIGATANSRNLIRWTKENPHYGQDIIGIVSNQNLNEGKHFEGVPIVGMVKDLDHLIDRYQAGGVVLADPEISKEVVTDLMFKCENKMISFKLVADFYGLMTHHVDVEYISNVPLLGLKSLPLDDIWNRVIKRLFDLSVSLFLLISLLPILVIVAIAIKVQDRGPIFYKQERVGQEGKHFYLYKLCTMMPDAELKSGPVWASRDDCRVTPLGRILRRTNLDELPQLWNVLVGKMSLVGPRPERPHFVQQFRDQIPRYMARHKIKSGLTGWAQIHGLRGNTSLEERIKYDLFYMENWTLVMDIEILFATLFAYKNAY